MPPPAYLKKDRYGVGAWEVQRGLRANYLTPSSRQKTAQNRLLSSNHPRELPPERPESHGCRGRGHQLANGRDIAGFDVIKARCNCR
jgi:hypothetical protein